MKPPIHPPVGLRITPPQLLWPELSTDPSYGRSGCVTVPLEVELTSLQELFIPHRTKERVGVACHAVL